MFLPHGGRRNLHDTPTTRRRGSPPLKRPTRGHGNEQEPPRSTRVYRGRVETSSPSPVPRFHRIRPRRVPRIRLDAGQVALAGGFTVPTWHVWQSSTGERAGVPRSAARGEALTYILEFDRSRVNAEPNFCRSVRCGNRCQHSRRPRLTSCRACRSGARGLSPIPRTWAGLPLLYSRERQSAHMHVVHRCNIA